MIDAITQNLFTERKTLLGVGPMSKNCVDVVIEISNTYEVPIQLIASRRQIECFDYGGGYVNSWTTENFAEYVLDKDKKGLVFLSRDHGGPWQNYKEVKNNMSFSDAMKSSKKSFEVDIENNFTFIHIDPSIDIHGELSTDKILERVYELYFHCIDFSRKVKKDILIEIGTEEQVEGFSLFDEINENLNKIIDFCIKNKMPKPYFYVVQNGSKVKETENTGFFKDLKLSDYKNDLEINKLIQINKLCLDKGIMPKAHNSDYLNKEASAIYPLINLKGGNIAPEFGVIETRTILKLLKDNMMNEEHELFCELSFQSKKWKKWLKENTKTDDYQKAIISGHYIFGTDEYLELEEIIKKKLRKKRIDLDKVIKENLSRSILGYLSFYGWSV